MRERSKHGGLAKALSELAYDADHAGAAQRPDRVAQVQRLQQQLAAILEELLERRFVLAVQCDHVVAGLRWKLSMTV